MNLGEAKRRIALMLDVLDPEQYEALKKCLTQGGGLLLEDRLDEKYQLRKNLEDALELLWEDCKKSGADFEKTIMQWTGGEQERGTRTPGHPDHEDSRLVATGSSDLSLPWETTIACMLLQGKFKEIKELAESI